MIVHVVSWSPSMLVAGGSGGFEWFYERSLAVNCLREHLGKAIAAETSHNLTLCVIEVAGENWLPEDVTNWLDENLHLVEPSLPSQGAPRD